MGLYLCIACMVLFLILWCVSSSRASTLKDKCTLQQRTLEELQKSNSELQTRCDEYSQQLASCAQRESAVSTLEKDLNQRRLALEEQQQDLDLRSRHLEYAVGQEIAQRLESCSGPLAPLLSYRLFRSLDHYDFDSNPRLLSASDVLPLSDIHVSANVRGSSGNLYHVALDSCTCPDFQRRHIPCKHMYALALTLGLPVLKSDSLQEGTAIFYERWKRYNEQVQLFKQLAKQEAAAKASLKKQEQELESIQNRLALERQEIQKVRETAISSAPWLAEELSCLTAFLDGQIEQELRQGKRPARKAAEQVARIRAEKKELVRQNHLYKTRLNLYESLVPWLPDLESEEEAEENYQLLQSGPEQEPAVETEYLSRAEIRNLPPSERNQRLLERYIGRPRSNWLAGIDFERYIGYEYERHGFRVRFNGALRGRSDLGRDLIVRKGKSVYIVQCKRWRAGREVRENAVFQLIGSVIGYSREHPEEHPLGVLVVTCALSETARLFAQYLGLEVHESVPFAGPGSYPLIKCHNAPGGEKIYHLPMDQQYDTVGIDFASGDFYARTVAEAEAAGFRRAHRWHPTPQS